MSGRMSEPCWLGKLGSICWSPAKGCGWTCWFDAVGWFNNWLSIFPFFFSFDICGRIDSMEWFGSNSNVVMKFCAFGIECNSAEVSCRIGLSKTPVQQRIQNRSPKFSHAYRETVFSGGQQVIYIFTCKYRDAIMRINAVIASTEKVDPFSIKGGILGTWPWHAKSRSKLQHLQLLQLDNCLGQECEKCDPKLVAEKICRIQRDIRSLIHFICL